MDTCVQVKADIPVELKRRTFAVLALRGLPFNRWLQAQMQEWLDEVVEESADQLGRKEWESDVCREVKC